MPDWMQTGANSEPAAYVLSSWLFLRLMGLIYLAAFASLATQIRGLAGQQGILPAEEFLNARKPWGIRRFYRLPTLAWISASDGFLLFLSWGGAVLAMFLVIGLAPLPVLVLLWVFYLSLFAVCRLFLAYQWDILLLETGFLAIFLAPMDLLPRFPPATAPPRIIVWLLWWLLFRLMFFSGVVKLRSRDPTWRNLTALCQHYETQPLPTPPAWYAHQLPALFHRASTAVLLAIELAAPFLIPGPAPLRYAAAGLFVWLMLLIQVTGNYCFFNLLGIALSVLLLDDRALAPVFHSLFPGASLPLPAVPAPQPFNWVAVIVTVLILPLSLETVFRLFRLQFRWPRPIAGFLGVLAPFHLVSSYGLFSVMTTERPEIIVEGSNDGVHWRAYEFRWKPGNVRRAPRFVAPHQPRLDWQMWFAALGYYQNNPWFIGFLMRLLQGSPPVLSLLKNNPFPKAPPRYVRGVLYDYRFSTRIQRRATGAWWRRERRGLYCPAIELNAGFSD